MPQYYCKEENYYIVNNFKVMWYFFKKQEKLKKNKDVPFLFNRLLENLHIKKKSNCYLLVRNPYDRIESFFRDKLRKNIDDKGRWQRNHVIFFNHIGVTRKTDRQTIIERLGDITFDTFMELLPQIYKQDRHLHPQYYVLHFLRWSKLKKHTFTKVMHMEKNDDLQFINDHLKLNVGIKHNHTKDVTNDIVWTEKSRKIANELYAKDFEHFGYEKLLK